MILRIILTFILLFSSSAVIALSISEDENSLQITSLMSAVIDGDVQTVDFFSKSDNEKINEKNIGGASALALACRKDNVEIVKILINSGANVNNIDNEGWTPLMRAANSGNYEIVDLLLTAKADVTKLNLEKEGALVQAAKSGCVKCFTAIFAKFDLTHFITTQQLKSQLNSSFALAKKQGNIELQNIITTQLGLIVDEKTQELKLDENFKIIENNFAPEEAVKSPKKLFKKSNKKFIFKANQAKKAAIKSEIVAENNNAKNFVFKESNGKMPAVKESPKAIQSESKAVVENNKAKKFNFKTGGEKLEKPVENLPEKSAEMQLEKNAEKPAATIEKPVAAKIVKKDNYLEFEENTGKKFMFKKER